MARPATSTSRLLAGSREPVRVATTGNIDPAAGGLQVIDGVTVEPSDRVLVKDQADQRQNGIYGASAGEWYRASDGRSPRAIDKGVTVHVQEGTVNGGKVYAFQTLDPVIGTDDIQISFYISDDIVADAEDDIQAAVDAATAAMEAASEAMQEAAAAAEADIDQAASEALQDIAEGGQEQLDAIAAAGGAITGIVSPIIIAENTFGTKGSVELWDPETPPDYVRTAGHLTAGDGGGALYKKVGSEPAHAGKIQSADGTWWELSENVVTLEMFGGKGLDTAADGAALVGAIGYINAINGGTIRGKAGRVYYIHLVGGSPGVSVTAPLRIDLNGATWKRPNDSMTSDFKRMATLLLNSTTAALEVFGGIINANHTGNLPSPPGSSDWEHNASIFVWANVPGVPSVYFHDLKLLDRWNYDHLALYAVGANSIERAVFERIESETAQSISLRADIIWTERCLNIHIDACTVHRMESEFDGIPDALVKVFISDSECLERLDIGGWGSAIGINFYEVYLDRVKVALFAITRAHLYDRECYFSDCLNMSPGTWHSSDSYFGVRDGGFPLLNAAGQTGAFVLCDYWVTRGKFRLIAGPQTVTSKALSMPSVLPSQVGFNTNFIDCDFLDDFGEIADLRGRCRFIRPKIKQLGAYVYHIAGTAGRVVDATIEGGDYSQCAASAIIRFEGFSAQPTYHLTLEGDWTTAAASVSSASAIDASKDMIINRRRIFGTTQPVGGLIGDIFYPVPAPVSGVSAKIATANSGSSPGYRAVAWTTAKAVTASRPVLTAYDPGVMHLDTTLDADGKPIWWTGTAWVDATGAVV